MTHVLTREVRFSINPFKPTDDSGNNPYCSKPCGQGLSLYFPLRVSVRGRVDPDTGFIMNVTHIDDIVRGKVVSLFQQLIAASYIKGREVRMFDMYSLLVMAWSGIQETLKAQQLVRLELGLNPNRKIYITSEKPEMFYFSEKFEFASMHTLWNEKFSRDENFEVFGKCANPTGHGHNYVLEVVIKCADRESVSIPVYQKTVSREVVDVLDHRNLNLDVDYFKAHLPTVENIAKFAWDRLEGQFTNCDLYSVTIWETDKTCCTYCPSQGES